MKSLSQPTEEFRKSSISVTGGSGESRELSAANTNTTVLPDVKHAPRNGCIACKKCGICECSDKKCVCHKEKGVR